MDKQTFTDQVLGMERTLYRVARSYLKNNADCADAVQEAITRAWAGRTTLRQPAYFRTWLTRILMNECKTLLRKRGHSQPYDPATLPEPPFAGDPPQLTDALDALEPPDRTALVLYYWEGYSLQEIAQLTHQPQGTVKSRLHRARARLRDILREEVFDDEAK